MRALWFYRPETSSQRKRINEEVGNKPGVKEVFSLKSIIDLYSEVAMVEGDSVEEISKIVLTELCPIEGVMLSATKFIVD